jgi:hypothetical protein
MGELRELTGMMDVTLRLYEKADELPPGPRECLKALAPYLVHNITICLEASRQLGDAPDLSQPIEDIVSIAHRTITPVRNSGEATKAAWLFLEATQRTFEVLNVDHADKNQIATFVAAMELGQADVRLTQVWSGLWDIMSQADSNATVAEGITKAREAGGAKRGEVIAAKARAWKAEALDIALARDQKPPHLNRQKMAMHIMERIKGETVPEFKSVDTWLRTEAEKPHGPVDSRARRKPA